MHSARVDTMWEQALRHVHGSLYNFNAFLPDFVIVEFLSATN
jgi:hypothetical protein